MPPMLAAAAGQMAMSAGQGFLQNAFNTGQTRENLNYYRMQRQDAAADWRRDTEYNSPSQMMARLKASGLSPHLIQGSSALTSAPQRQSPNATPAPSSYQVNGAANTMNIRIGLEQLKNMQMQNVKTEAEIANISADTKRKTLEYDSEAQGFNDDGMSVINKRKLYQLEQMLGEMGLTSQRTLNTAQSTANLGQQNRNMQTQDAINKIEEIFRKDLLSGKKELTRQEIQRAILGNQRTKAENVYVPENARNQAEKLGYVVKNDSKVSQRPVDMPNYGFLPSNPQPKREITR